MPSKQSTAPISAADSALREASYAQHLASIAPIQSFHVKGRIGVQTKHQGFSGGIDWQHATTKDSIALYSPLGGQVASVERSPESVTLTDAKGHSISAKDAETLTQTALGWQLPLAGLADWSIGRPYLPCDKPVKTDCALATDITIEKTLDATGRLLTLKQDGWKIEYQEYSPYKETSLPSKLYLTSPNVNIKLIIEHIISE